MQKYAETDYPVTKGFKKKIAHAEFRAELKVEGTVAFTEASANSTLVSLIDKYGIHWYLNHNNSSPVSSL